MKTALLSGLAIAVLAGPVPGQPAPEKKVTLAFIWHAGDLADQFLKISRGYTAETGVEIKAILPPLSAAYYEQIAEEFRTKGSAFDLCMFDSQSMSEFASGGHLVRLNDMMAKSGTVSAAAFDAGALRRYAEYPEGSGDLYALPINQDCMGLVYRRDLIEDPQERAAFKERYGYDLAVPATWVQFRDIAEFFTRPQEDLHGVALYGSADYDACTSAFNNVFWSFGCELWDPGHRRASSYINSPQAKAALDFFVRLFDFAPPACPDGYVTEVNEAVKRGEAAMAVQWYYFFHELSAAASGTQRLGFAPLPAAREGTGENRRCYMVGGQGVAISRYCAHPEEAWKFLEWFMGPKRQWEWVEAGGRTGLAAILNDRRFAEAGPGNDTFAAAMSMTKDYWHLPEYPQLLKVYQDAVHGAITGKATPEESLDRCAAEQDAILGSGKATKRRSDEGGGGR